MPTPKLPIGCGVYRARRNRKRPGLSARRPLSLAQRFFDEPKAVIISKAVLKRGAA